jgi:hypothetical protein
MLPRSIVSTSQQSDCTYFSIVETEGEAINFSETLENTRHYGVRLEGYNVNLRPYENLKHYAFYLSLNRQYRLKSMPIIQCRMIEHCSRVFSISRFEMQIRMCSCRSEERLT